MYTKITAQHEKKVTFHPSLSLCGNIWSNQCHEKIQFEGKVRELRLRWFGHVLRTESQYSGQWMMQMEGRGIRGEGEMEEDYPLWRPLMGTAERRQKISHNYIFSELH